MLSLLQNLTRKIGYVCVLIGLQSSVVFAAPPTFSAAFNPTTVAAETESVLTYTLTSDADAVRNGQFSHSLNPELILASPTSLSSNCDGVSLTGTDGGSSLSVSGIALPPNSSCTISASVKPDNGVGPTVVTATSDDFTSDAGNSGTASANLTVVVNRPSYNLSFTPDSVSVNGLSRLSINIDNSLNGSNWDFGTGTVNMPVGLSLATVPNHSTTCTGGILAPQLTVNQSSNSLSFSFIYAAAGASCEVSIDVQAEQLGSPVVKMTSLTSNGANNSGNASTALAVVPAFADVNFDPLVASPGGTTTLNFVLHNRDRAGELTNISFTNDLDALLSGLTITSATQNDICGAGSQISGTSVLSFTGGVIAAESSCSFSVEVLVPANAAAATYTNNITDITDSTGARPTSTNVLIVSAAPVLTMDFVDGGDLTTSTEIVTPGEDIAIKFTLTNADSVNSATDISFSQEVNQLISGTTIKTLPAGGSCGAGSSFTSSVVSDVVSFNLSAGNLAASASCEFDVILTIPQDATSGTYNYSSSNVSAIINANNVVGLGTNDTISVVGGPVLSFSLSPDSVSPDGQVTASFTLTTNANAIDTATNLSFTMDLDGALTGMTAAVLPADNSCGAGSTVTGSGVIQLSGGSIAADDSCSFDVVLAIPAGAAAGTYTLVSSVVSSTVSGYPINGAAVDDSFSVSGLSGTMSFADDPVANGDSTTLSFTLNNAATAMDASSIVFTLNLNSALSGLSATSLPATPCGASSTITGTTNLTLSGAELVAGASCNFDVTVLIPAGAATSTYNVVTSNLSAMVNGSNTSNPALFTTLNVEVDEAPSVVLSSSSSPSTSVSPINVTMNFNEDVTGFDVTDINGSVTNGTLSNFTAVSASQYTVDITPLSDGQVTLQVPADSAQDLGTNGNNLSAVFSIQYDSVAFVLPTAAIGAADQSLASQGPINFPITVSDADPAQINLTAAKVNLITTGDASATVTVVDGTTANPTVQLNALTGNGTLAISLNADIARNGFGSTAATGNSSQVSIDTTPPSVTLTTGAADPINTAFSISIDFSDPVINFSDADLVLSNANVGSIAGGPINYTATVTPITDGEVTVDLPVNVATDPAGNGNTAASQLSITYDATAPAGYDFTFDQSFLNASNHTAMSFSYTGAEIGTSYSYSISDGSTSVSDTGVVTSANDNLSNIDVSGLLEGTLTMSFFLTDAATNVGIIRTGTIVKQYNAAPIITEGASITVNMSEDSTPTAFSLTLNATDAESETISWSISSNAANGIATVSGTGNSKIIDYVPAADFEGTDSFVVEISDGNSLDPLTDSILVNVNVAAQNDAPIFDSTEITGATEDLPYTYNLVTSDIDTGDVLTITAPVKPVWLNLTDAGDGTAILTGTPQNSDVGNNTVNLLVTDSGGLTQAQDFVINVINTNDAPTIDSVGVTAATEDSVYTYSIVASDIDLGDSMTISASVLPSWLTLTDAGDGTAVLTGTPLNDDVGNNSVTIDVVDLSSATDSQTFTIVVANTNDVPVFASSAITTATEDSGYVYNIIASDVDLGDSLVISSTGLPTWLSLVDAGNGTAVLSGTPLNEHVGNNAVTLRVTDLAGLFVEQSFTVNVVNTNDIPSLDSTPVLAVSEDSSYTYNISASDVDVGDSLSISASTLPGWLTLTDAGNGTAVLTGTPLNDDVGNNSVTLNVFDVAGATDSQVFTIVVANTNDVPVFASSAIATATEDSNYVYNITASDVDLGDSLVISTTGLPTWLSLVDAGNGTAVLSGVPLNEHVGSNAVTLRATDLAGLFIEQSFIINVINTNDLPSLDSTPVLIGTEDSLYTYNISASDIDVDDSLVIRATVLPTWLTLSDAGNGTAMLTGTPLNANVGNNPVTLVVSDLGGLSATQSFVIEVINTNDNAVGLPVVVGSLVREQTLSVNTTAITDDDGLGTFNYQWIRGGNAINGATGSTYLLGEDDVWLTFSVQASFIDGAGNLETVTSLATDVVFDLDSDGDGIYDLEEGTGDSDGDGIPDYLDEDSDNDGIPDSEEGNGDSDGDGIADYLDTSLDEDGDGIPDILEGRTDLDTDGDGINDAFDTDSDNDGISDANESGASGVDSDGDGIDDTFDVDVTGGPDANGDGIDDNATLLDSDSDGIADYLDRDSDNDSVPDALENNTGLLLKAKSSGSQKQIAVIADTDGDGINDYLDADSDNDGISDLAEAATNPVDSDLDQIIDEFDVDFTGGVDLNLDGVDDAAVLKNSDNDATPDMFDLDSDNDGLNDVSEAQLSDVDSNAQVDSPAERTDSPIDTDNDGLPDYRDLDSDDDGIFDIVGGGAASLDLDNNGQIDSSQDSDGDGIVDEMDDEPNQFGTSRDRDGDGIPSSIDKDDDGDGISDIVEGNADTDGDGLIDSLDTDSDNDGLSDSYEADRLAPLGEDTDRDGIDDRYDVDFIGGADENADGISDNLTEADTDQDGIPDFQDKDSDNDNIPDSVEQLLVTLSGVDANANGLDDAVDSEITGGIDLNGDGQDDSSIASNDLDNDGLQAFRDTDTDGDGILDKDENGDFNQDGVNDRLQVDVEVKATSGGGAMNLILVLLAGLTLIFRKSSKLLAKFAALACFVATPLVSAAGICKDSTQAAATCWYTGIGFGQSRFEPQTELTSWQVDQDRDSAYKLFVGVDFQKNWFAELAQAKLGEAGLRKANPSLQQNGAIDYTVTELAAGYRINAASEKFSVSLKAGWAWLETESNFIADESESLGLLGLGVNIHTNNQSAIGLNYTRYGDDISFVALTFQQYY